MLQQKIMWFSSFFIRRIRIVPTRWARKNQIDSLLPSGTLSFGILLSKQNKYRLLLEDLVVFGRSFRGQDIDIVFWLLSYRTEQDLISFGRFDFLFLLYLYKSSSIVCNLPHQFMESFCNTLILFCRSLQEMKDSMFCCKILSLLF